MRMRLANFWAGKNMQKWASSMFREMGFGYSLKNYEGMHYRA